MDVLEALALKGGVGYVCDGADISMKDAGAMLGDCNGDGCREDGCI